MKLMILIGFALAVLAQPATAHPHGAKSKRYQGKSKTQRTYRAKRRQRRARRYRLYWPDNDDSCSVEPDPHHQDYPYWAACGFTPKSLR